MLARRTNLTPTIAEPVFRDFDRLFDAFTAPALRTLGAEAPAFPINVWHDDQAVVVEAELPGVTADQIDIDADRETLAIRATRTTESRTETPAESDANGADRPTRRIVRTERYEGTVERRLALPTPVNPDAVTANLRDGVLTVRLPRTDATERRRIKVDTN